MISQFEQTPDLELDFGEFDINAAFQAAVSDTASNAELALEDKVWRMAAIIEEGSSEVYRDFIDFRQMAASMEMLCNHDHALNELMQANDTLNGFMESHKTDDDEYEIDPKTGKRVKKKKYAGWLSLVLL